MMVELAAFIHWRSWEDISARRG